MKADWIVTRYGKMKRGYYQYWVSGRNLSDNGQHFFWLLPDIDNNRFDWTNAFLCDDVKDYNLEKRLIIL